MVHSEEYGLSTAGNDCKWQATHPQEDEYTLEACVGSLQYAINETQAFRGHNLCWGNDNPKWLTCGAMKNESSLCNYTASELKGFLVDHIETVMPGVRAGGGGAQIYAWYIKKGGCILCVSLTLSEFGVLLYTGVYVERCIWFDSKR